MICQSKRAHEAGWVGDKKDTSNHGFIQFLSYKDKEKLLKVPGTLEKTRSHKAYRQMLKLKNNVAQKREQEKISKHISFRIKRKF